MTVDGLDLVKLNSIILIQRADNLVVGTSAVADIQVAIVGNHRGCDHVTAHGIRLGSADADPAAQCDGVAPTVAGLVDEVIVDLHGTGSLGAERGCLGIRVGVNLGGDQFLFGDGIVRCRSSGPGVVSLPVGIQDLAERAQSLVSLGIHLSVLVYQPRNILLPLVALMWSTSLLES